MAHRSERPEDFSAEEWRKNVLAIYFPKLFTEVSYTFSTGLSAPLHVSKTKTQRGLCGIAHGRYGISFHSQVSQEQSMEHSQTCGLCIPVFLNFIPQKLDITDNIPDSRASDQLGMMLDSNQD